jgi:hypothetical protein
VRGVGISGSPVSEAMLPYPPRQGSRDHDVPLTAKLW